MRKIEQKMIDAVLQRKAWSERNTAVRHDHDSGDCIVSLHGHDIAKVMYDPAGHTAALHVTLAGWNTNTTRSRLSALIYALMPNPGPHGCGVSTRQGQARLHDADGRREIDSRAWHSVKLIDRG